MKSAVVTGGAGFIGSHLCDHLSSAGVQVTSIDNYSTGIKDNHVKGVEYIQGDCLNIVDALSGIRADVVFHLGEYSRVERSVEEPFAALANTYATLPSVIQYAVESGAKLIYSGSSTKFGDAESPYSIAKSLNTELVMRFCEGRIPYAITYFYNVYGGMEIASGPYATVVAKFLEMKRKGTKVIINAPGTQRRNFTHVSDIVDGLARVASRGEGDGYGIGADESYSIIDLADMIGVEYEIGGEKEGNRQSSNLYTEKIRELGWRQTVFLPEYIRGKANAP